MIKTLFRLLFLCFAIGATATVWRLVGYQFPFSGPSAISLASAKEQARSDLASLDLRKGQPVFIRIFKQESVLELWMRNEKGWVRFRDYDICAWSGRLGPKLKEGDRQSPEGFYRVKQSSLNPNSKFHLSFNLGFPNAFDRAHGRTGSFLMVHGRCVSIGCYAMTDPAIDVIYGLVESALTNGQPHVPVHIFPFRMTKENLSRHSKSKWIGFWQSLKPAWKAFNQTQEIPRVTVRGKHYVIEPRGI